MSLREELHESENLFEVDAVKRRVLADNPIFLDGRLPGLTEEQQSRLDYEIGPLVRFLPLNIRQAAEAEYEGLTPREINLLESGAELVIRIFQAWVRIEGVPEP